MIAKLLVIFSFSLISPQQDSLSASFLPLADSSDVTVRTTDAQTLQQLTADPVFNYQEEAVNQESFLSRLRNWFLQMLGIIFSNRWASVIVKFIFFGIFAIVLVSLFNRLLGGQFSNTFTKKSPGQSLSTQVSESELSAANYDELLASALSENRYPDAVRILYLKALQQLSQQKLINWKPDKTNHDYVQELGSHPTKNDFNRLTTYYEYVEYGDFEIQKDGFQNVQRLYQEFSNRIHS